MSIKAIDLRRGLTDESAFDQLTMHRCLDEILKSEDTLTPPKFVVLLGDRYGSRPLPK